ncbi:GTP pyrophosphokinase [Paenibacillus sp. KN14-4R]|uniref:GTP pyrophosphokinase n=1 Tax=Paenibacillus sp. KN14-4R TaxID=3445773 RepID=UPI003FA169F4
MEVDELIQEYRQRSSLYRSLEEEAIHIIKLKLESVNIKINKIESRIKSEDSLKSKVERKEITNPFDEVRDILGVRIVCLFLSDVEKIRNSINDVFEILEEDNKIDNSDLNSFGYMSVHFIVKLNDEYRGPRYDAIKGLLFEIQVRTMTMDAWANISHYLDYKTEKDIPKDLKKDFFALSGLFFVADKHFELFFNSRQNAKEQLIEQFEQHQSQEEDINIDSLNAYMEVKFPDRKRSDAKAISSLVDDLYQFGLTKISEIDAMISRTWDAFLLYESERPPHSEPGRIFNDVGVIRIILRIVNEEYYKFQYGKASEGTLNKYRALIK